MKIYKVHQEFFAQKQKAIGYAIEQSMPDWDSLGEVWIPSIPCIVSVYDCDTKEKIVDLLNSPDAIIECRTEPERLINVWHDMNLSDAGNKDATVKTYIKEGAKDE